MELPPCGVGFEYLHHSSASRRRRQKGSLESGTVKYGRQSHGTRIRWIRWLRWRGPVALLNDRPILSSERMLHKDYDRKCSIEKKNGRGSQVASRQDSNSEPV
jgi:hypothetical protein